MPYPATVFQVMIASPGDVVNEAQLAIKVIHEWNANHAKEKNTVLMPVHWTTHASPETGAPPQEVINDQILKDSDLLVGIFGTRLGTPTGKAPSGTVEEIEKHTAAGKPAMLYFSTANEGKLDEEALRQFQALTEFRERLEKNQQGLFWRFSSLQDFENQFRNHLTRKVNNHPHFKENSLPSSPFGESAELIFDIPERGIELSAESKALLKTASKSEKSGTILNLLSFEGRSISVDGAEFVSEQSPREKARWESALEELEYNGLIKDEGHKREIFSLTQRGFDYADELPDES